MKVKRSRCFRGLQWTCECGHVNVETTSFYRLSKDRVSLIIGYLIRRAWCDGCNANSIPVEIGSVVKCEE